VIDHSCPVIVLDDVKQELWQISHGLAVCGLPIMAHWINEGKLERQPITPYEGVRILFTDLHVLGPTHKNPEQYVSALVSFIQQLIGPSTYLVVFWSGFPEDAAEAWKLLCSRLKTAKADNLVPFAYRVLDKTDVMQISDDDPRIAAQATERVQKSIAEIFDAFPQLRSLMQWESCASRAASATSNELIDKLDKGGIEFTNGDAVRVTLKSMSQAALGLPHAPDAPTKGVYQALMPIAQDWLNKEAAKGALDGFLGLAEKDPVPLPQSAEGRPKLASLLNDFFIHSERDDLKPSERGAVIRLSEDFLKDEERGLVREIGLTKTKGDWREALCIEFAHGFSKAPQQEQTNYKNNLDPKNVYAVELSADCDYAQDKKRSHRFLLALFVPTNGPTPFYSKSKGAANDAIYVTPEITFGGVQGRLLISCRIFLTRPYQTAVEGVTVTRMRQEVLSEIAHHYSTHMRRPGKIEFR
jgi:hypothetical protein